jgi:hypothetical protein
MKEAEMPINVPCTNKAGDILKFLRKMPGSAIPLSPIDDAYIKKLGISASSAANLQGILKQLGFVDDNLKASSVWSDYVSSDDRARILAAAIKTAYPGLFKEMMCPYLGDDESLLDYFKSKVSGTPREIEYCLETFRALSEMADFQDTLNDYDYVEPAVTPKMPELETIPQLKVDPNLQMNIQIHIDPNTPDEKIETIFKYMRKYLLGKD